MSEHLDQRRALSWARQRALWHGLQMKLANARLRVAVVVGCSLVFWIGLFVLFREGFDFFLRYRLIGGAVVELLFSAFFFTLTVMLTFSTGIILYGSLYDSDEARFLLVRPIPADVIFAHQFTAALFFSSWGFVLLGSPSMAAYGLTTEAPAWFYGLSLIYFVLYPLIPGSMGAVLCLLVANCFPRRRRSLLVGIGAVVGIGAGVWLVDLWRRATAQGGLNEAWLQRLIDQLRVLNQTLMPSRWISQGLLAATHVEGLGESLYYLGLIVTQGMMLFLLTAWAYRHWHRRGYNRAHSDALQRDDRPSAHLARWVDVLASPLPRSVRTFIVKDVRIMTRDPLQWSQILILAGLLALYFTNVGKMQQNILSPYWKSLIGIFNLAVVGLILAAFNSRFVFPQMSLEGQQLWVLGLCPFSRDSILWGKFLFNAAGAWVVTSALASIGCWRLQLSPLLSAAHLLAIAMMCLGLSAISVGLGARFIEPTERDPSKIAAGVGGTINLVVCLIFLIAVIATIAVPTHLFAIRQEVGLKGSLAELAPGTMGLTGEQLRYWLPIGMAGCVLVGLFTTISCLRVGIRAFRQLEA